MADDTVINWNKKFKDFPEIPEPKKWNELGRTQEQILTKKILDGIVLSISEENELEECFDFYGVLIPMLKKLDFRTLENEEIEKFKKYYLYAFNYLVLAANDLWVSNLYRLVENKAVSGKNERLRNQSFLSYPPLDVVSSKRLFNRANTPEFNVFYATDSIDNALLELKPEPGNLVSVGIWVPMKNNPLKLISYPISHNPLAIEVNPEVRKGFIAFQKAKKENHPLLMRFMEIMFGFISDEFAKPVVNPISYYYSAIFAESIFRLSEATYQYDCILYPSVGNKFKVENLAIKPEIIDKKFKLERVLEFEIVNTFYQKEPPRKEQNEITVVDYKNLIETDWIEKDGYIVW